MTKKWLYKSLENGSFLPLEDYFLPIFNELKIGVLGFSSNELAEIKQKIEEKCGVIITDINEITKTKEDLLLIFLKTSEIKTYESFLHTLNKPVVHESWFRNCLEKNVFIRPEHFLLGHKGITQKISNQKELFHEEIRILSENKLKKCLKEIDCSDISYRFLSECVIYFFNIEETYEKILKDVVNLTGAFYLNHYNISITHIVSQHYQEEDLSNFRKIGDNFFVVHPLWLKDCFFYKKKVSEFEYHLMPGVNLHAFSAENQSFIINSRNNNNALLRRTISNDETFSFREKKIHKPIKFSQENQFAKNISQENPDKNKKKMASPPFSKENPMVVKSFIFLNVNFFINTPDYKELLPYRMKILENSGRIVDNLKNSKLQIYYVLSDGISSLKIKAQNLENVNYVSFRWVDYCIEKKQVVKNHLELRLIHLSPLTFKMPLPCFKKSHMYVCGFPTQEKIILKSLMTVMGINILFDVYDNYNHFYYFFNKIT